MDSLADTLAIFTPGSSPRRSRTQEGDAAAGRWPGDDFAAWLPPMLVKELRQGVQSGVFFWTLLFMQAAAFVVFSLRVLSSEAAPRAERTFMTVFWIAAAAAAAGIVPLRGLWAIDGERSGNSLDLLQLSRLSATRIVVGKWTALVAQSALVAVTILPYLVCRYFFGGVDVLADVRGLGWLLAAAAALAAVAIALSTLPVWLRITIAVAVCGLGAVLVADGPLENLARRFASGRGFSGATQAGILCAMAAYTIACLEFAAARIAPPAENHAMRRRLLALVVASAWPVAGWLGTGPAAVATFLVTGPLLVGFAVGASIERPSRVRTLFAVFRRAGVAGRVAAAAFTPGWASGLVFIAILAAVCLAGWTGYAQRTFVWAVDRPVFLALAALLVAVILCPLPFTTFLTRARSPLLLYGLVQLVCFMVFAIANGCKPTSLPWSTYAVGRFVTLPFPLGAATAFLVVGDNDWKAMRDLAPTYMLAGLGVIVAVVAVMARPWVRELSATGRLVRGETVALPQAAAVRRRPADSGRPWVWRGNDFPGWLSPMLVRELRQGVQSGVFAWTFVAIQGAMFLLMTWALSRTGGGSQRALSEVVAACFWAAIAAAIVVVVPLRGLTMVSGEQVAGSLDLVRLTRLSATRIIVGKWLATVGQGLLVATAVLPYLVLRYFFGGLDIVSDLAIFGWMVVASMAVAAAAIALSTLPLWQRIVAVMIGAAVAFVPVVALLEQVGRRRHVFWGTWWGGTLGVLAAIAICTIALLEYAAARIAPPAENHAGRQRLIGIVIGVAWAAIGFFAPRTETNLSVLLVGPLLLCYAIGSLVERPVPVATLYRPFRRWGLAGRLAAAVFTPGWATAVPFVAIVAGLWLAGWLSSMGRFAPGDFLQALAVGSQIVAAVVFPLPAFTWWPRLRQRLVVYAAAQLACFVVFVLLAAVAAPGVSWRTWPGWLLTLPFPSAALSAFVATNGSKELSPIFLTAAVATTLVVLLVVARPWSAEMRHVMKHVRGGSARLPVKP